MAGPAMNVFQAFKGMQTGSRSLVWLPPGIRRTTNHFAGKERADQGGSGSLLVFDGVGDP